MSTTQRLKDFRPVLADWPAYLAICGGIIMEAVLIANIIQREILP